MRAGWRAGRRCCRGKAGVSGIDPVTERRRTGVARGHGMGNGLARVARDRKKWECYAARGGGTVGSCAKPNPAGAKAGHEKSLNGGTSSAASRG